MSSSATNNSKGPLEAAQKIVAELTGMNADHQKLALKFATEALGLPLPSGPPSAAAPTPQSTQPTSSHAASADHSTDIRSFTAMKAPKTDQQFAAIVAYFYQFEAKEDERKEAIDADLMKEAARLAGRRQVSQWINTLNNAKNSGYLDTAGNGKFKLSSVGENLVAITLPGNGGRVQEK